MASSSLHLAFALGLGLAAAACMPRASADPIDIETSMAPLNTTGFAHLNLEGAPLGSAAPFTFRNDDVSFVGLQSDQGIVKGALPGAYNPPVTDVAGDSFSGRFLSTGNTGYINIAFTKPQQTLALLWGSVDASNQITFLDDNQVVGTVTGSDIDASASGFQGYGGSFYVLLSSAVKFDDIEISSGTPSFELAELRTDPSEIPIHEPASVTLLGAGLLGLLGLRRRL